MTQIDLAQRPAWSRESWRRYDVQQAVTYAPAALEEVLGKLRSLPPLVTSWEIEELKSLVADAQEGRRFLLHGGDCAETLAGCEPDTITRKLKILLQMSLVLVRGAQRPVIRVGRFAGQYAKPRSRPTEVRDGVELPSYFGDLVNRTEFSAAARTPDPQLLLSGYFHAAVTLNFIRSLSGGSFSDLRHPEYFDLPACGPVERARAADALSEVRFYASHEGLNLFYEEAQTRRAPRRDGFYDMTTHLPWIGERTRGIAGAHVEFFRGVENPVALKLGPSTTAEEAIALCDVLNPRNEPGKLVLVTRLGADHVERRLPALVAGVSRRGRRVLWVCDPMHGNTKTTQGGVKTRDFDDIVRELSISAEVHDRCGTCLGGVHLELSGDDVTECIGGGVAEADLGNNYATLCDPRLNDRQAMQLALSLARRWASAPAAPRASDEIVG